MLHMICNIFVCRLSIRYFRIFYRLFRLISAIEINPGEYSGRINGDDTIDKWYKFERPNTYFNQIKEQVKQHVSTLESFESLDQPL